MANTPESQQMEVVPSETTSTSPLADVDNNNPSLGLNPNGHALDGVAVSTDSQALELSLPPPPTDQAELAAYDPGILMLLGVIRTSDKKHEEREKKNDEHFTDFQAEVKSEFGTVHERIDDVEEEVVQIAATTTTVVRKVTVLENRQRVTENNVKSIDQRVVALESGSRPTRRKTTTEVLEAEIANIDDLLKEAKRVDHVVVVGCHGRREPSRQGIADLVKSYTSDFEVRYDVRGLVARIFFGHDGSTTASQRATAFVNDVATRQSAATYWAKIDEPRFLRDLRARARLFGEAVISYCSTRLLGSDTLRFSIVNGFLVIGDVVVGPLTLIPGATFHDEVVPVVAKIILDPRHRPVDYKSPLGQQLRRSIAEKLIGIHQKPMFVDTAEEVLSARDEAIAFVHGVENTGTVSSGEQSAAESDTSSPEPPAAPPARKRKKKQQQPNPSKKKNKNSKTAPSAPKKHKQSAPMHNSPHAVHLGSPGPSPANVAENQHQSEPRPRTRSDPTADVVFPHVDSELTTADAESFPAFVSPLSQLRNSIHSGTDPPSC